MSFKTDYSTFANVNKFLMKAECKPLGFDYGDDVSGDVCVPLDIVETFANDLSEVASGKIEIEVGEQISYQSVEG